MTFEEQLKHLPRDIIGALYREKLLAQGRYDAFVFVQESRGNIACLKEKIAWYEELMTNPPDDWKGPMSPGSSVRLHKEGYLPGLKDALKILEQADGSAPRAAAPVPARAPALAAAEERSPYNTPSEPVTAAPSESMPPATAPTKDG
jgi:hypothetical protein